MEQNEINRAISSIQTGQKTIFVQQEGPSSSTAKQQIITTTTTKANPTIISTGTSLLRGFPSNITMTQQAVVVTNDQTPIQVVQQQQAPATASTAKNNFDRRVVVERIGDTFKMVQTPAATIQPRQVVTLPRAVPQNVKFIKTSAGAIAPVVIAARPFRPIAPKPQVVQTQIVKTQMVPLQTGQQQQKVEASKLDKIVIVRKTPQGVTEIVKLPQPGTSTKEPPTPITKTLTGEEKLDQLMKKVLDETSSQKEDPADVTTEQKTDFHSKELQLIKNLKRSPSVQQQQKKDIPILPKPIRSPVLLKPQPIVVPKNPQKIDFKLLSSLIKSGQTLKVEKREKTPEPLTELKSQFDDTIELSIMDGQISDPNGPIIVMGAESKSPKKRSLSLFENVDKSTDLEKPHRSASTEETPTKMEDERVKDFSDDLLCDEKIDQTSPDKIENTEPVVTPRIGRQNKRKTAHKTLIDAKVEKDDDLLEVKEEEEEIDSYEIKLTKRSVSPSNERSAKRKATENDNESDEGGVADVLQVPISKLFEYGVEPDDIYLTDPFRYINWKDGIGSLRNGSSHFKINEYGVYEIMSNEEYYQCKRARAGDKHLQESLGGRTNKKSHPPNASLYLCAVCGESGLAEEFIEPRCCSWQCKDSSNQRQRLQILDEGPLKYESQRSSPEASQSSSESDEELLEGSWIKETDAPLKLFRNAIPKMKNLFTIGMKVEAVDPHNQGLFCVCTVVDRRGFRIKLRFDGFPADYDFWKNADAKTIFPPGWCAATGRTIEPPAQWPSNKKFNWNEYLKDPKVMAPVQLFPHLKEEVPSKWEKNMKCEAVMSEGEGIGVTAATIRDIISSRVLIHLDFYKTNYWVSIDSNVIHPVDYHQEQRIPFNSPMKDFNWETYLKQEKAKALPDDAFSTRLPMAFRPGMKLEVVDPKNQSLLRSAQVVNIDSYRIKILFDGWPATYAFWMNDDDPDLHPVGWAKATKHPLEPVVAAGKPTEVCHVFRGCLGIGNFRNKTRPFHRVPDECPYHPKNWIASELTDRLQPQVRRKIWNKKPTVEKHQTQQRESESSPEKDKTVTKKKLAPKDAATQREDLWSLNSNNLPEFKDETTLYTWNAQQIHDLVAEIPGCHNHAGVFEKENINGAAFISLTKEDLMDSLGIKFGPALKIYNRVLKLREIVLKQTI